MIKENLNKIELKFGKKLKLYSVPPSDPYNEYSPFGFGWENFCYYEDSEILLYYNSYIINIQLFCDLFDIHEDIFYISEALSEGKIHHTGFPEKQLFISFKSGQSGYDITLSAGNKHLADFTAEPLFILEQFYGIMEMLLEKAVSGDYVTREDANEYLDSLKPFIEKLKQ